MWWKESIINTFHEIFIDYSAHCDRLCVVEVICQVQVNFLNKVITFLIWKCHFFPLILSLFLPGVSNPLPFEALLSFQHLAVKLLPNWNSDISTSRHCRHSVQKAVDLTTPGKNRDKMSGKKWHFQILKVLTLVRKLTWTWQLTSTTHSLSQCALCSINISW